MRKFLMIGLLLIPQLSYTAEEPDDNPPFCQELNGKLLMIGGAFTTVYGLSQLTWPLKPIDDMAYRYIAGGTGAFIAGVKIWTSPCLQQRFNALERGVNDQYRVYPVDQATYNSDTDVDL